MLLESHVKRKWHFRLSYNNPEETQDRSIVLCSEGLSTQSKLVVCLETGDWAGKTSSDAFLAVRDSTFSADISSDTLQFSGFQMLPLFVALRHSKSYMQTVKNKFNFPIFSVPRSKLQPKWQLNWGHHWEATTWAGQREQSSFPVCQLKDWHCYAKSTQFHCPWTVLLASSFTLVLPLWGYHKLGSRSVLSLSSFSLQFLSPELPALTSHSQQEGSTLNPQVEGSLVQASWETLTTKLISAEAKDILPLPEGTWKTHYAKSKAK